MESAQNDHRRTAVERETTSAAGGKRKRSPLVSLPYACALYSHSNLDVVCRSPTVPVHVRPPSGLSKGHHETVEIDYLARRYADDLLLVSGDESLPNILSLIDEYEGVLQRHESMAANLGAKPLGQTLMKRFERIFDGPVKIVQSHGKESVRVSWLDVVEMYRNKPQDFVIVETRSGGRVCQLWSKGCKVEISEDDFTLIKSGMPQKLIPPQPIHEDEEKELGTLEILEKRLLHVIGLTDAGKLRIAQVSGRALLTRSPCSQWQGEKAESTAASAQECHRGWTNIINDGREQSLRSKCEWHWDQLQRPVTVLTFADSRLCRRQQSPVEQWDRKGWGRRHRCVSRHRGVCHHPRRSPTAIQHPQGNQGLSSPHSLPTLCLPVQCAKCDASPVSR